MPKPRTDSGEKNLIHARLKQLRQEHDMSQRDLAHALQLMGIDIDKNVITRIETNQRYVTDIEIQAFAVCFISVVMRLSVGFQRENSNPYR